jgi:protein required for attachment to host cells
MNVRVLVVDEREANFFDAKSAVEPLQMRGAMVNDTATLHDRDLETDRGGSSMNRGAPGKHGIDGDRSSKRHFMELFARHVARAVDDARARNEFDRLVIVAGPRMLGWLRDALPEATRSVVAAEIPKDLLHSDPSVIRDVVPREAFSH